MASNFHRLNYLTWLGFLFNPSSVFLARVRLVATGICFAVLGTLLITGEYAAALLALLTWAIGLVFYRWRATSTEADFLLALYWAALAIRLVVASLTYYGSLAFGQGGIVFPDEGAYADVAWSIAQAWRGIGEPINVMLGHYTTLEAAVFFAVGRDLMVLKVINSAFGAGTAILIACLGALVFSDKRVGKLAGIICAFFPSLILWNSLNLRDSFALFTVGLTLAGSVLFFSRPTGTTWLLFVVPWFLLKDLRDWVFISLGWVLLISGMLMPFASWRRRITAMAVVGLTVVLLPFWLGYGPGGLDYIQVSRINSERSAMAARASSAFVLPTGTSDPGTAVIPSATSPSPVPTTLPGSINLGTAVIPSGTSPTTEQTSPVANSIEQQTLGTIAHIPVGLVYVLGAPFPWVVYNWWFRAAVPEMLLWYLLMAFAFYGALKSSSQWRRWFLLAAYIGTLIMIMAIIEGNVGTLARHRVVIVSPFVFIFSAQGLVKFWEKRRARIRLESDLQFSQNLPD